MLKKIALVLVALAAAVLGYAATRPDTFRVQRTTTIDAPPERVHALIHDFRAWGAWSPYEKLDPDMKRSHSGAAAGTGAVYAWDGEKAGAGRMEITGTTPSRIAIRLDFAKPFEAHNTAEFTLEPRGVSTRVTWAMHGPNHFVGKVMGIFVDMDRLVGKDFEAGLAALKAAAEG